MQKREILRREFLEAMRDIEVVDAHSHTRTPEQYYLRGPYNLFTLESYFERELHGLVSGIPYAGCENDEQRWLQLKSALDKGRNVSFWRHNIVTYQKLYALNDDELDDNNWGALNEAIISKSQDRNWYDYVTRKVCGIKKQILNIPWFEYWFAADLIKSSGDADAVSAAKWQTDDLDRTYFKGLLRMEYALFSHKRPIVEKLGAFTNVSIDNLSTLERAIQTLIRIYIKKGIIGIKLAHAYFRTLKSSPVKRADAERIFSIAMSGHNIDATQVKQLQDYLIYLLIEMCNEGDLLCQIHTGIQWADLSDSNPLHLMPLLEAFPNVRFDILHAGIPFIHESSVLGKLFPNVYMNMALTYVISMAMAKQTLSELIDLVPGNRILAFGSDVEFPEMICGHLEMAFSCVSEVLADKVCNDFLSKREAIALVKKIFCQNGTELYRI